MATGKRSDTDTRLLSSEEILRRSATDILERHVRSRACKPAVLVRNYGMQDMEGLSGFDGISMSLRWLSRDSLNFVVDTEWLGHSKRKPRSGREGFRDDCWYVPFDWKIPIECIGKFYETGAICIKNLENTSE